MNQIQDFLPSIKAYVEGVLDETLWPQWLAENATSLESALGRYQYLRLKLRTYKAARELLDEYGVEYQLPDNRCRNCHHLLVPYQTEEAAQSGEPNTPRPRCPNGCDGYIYINAIDWEAFSDAHDTCEVIVRPNGLPLPLSGYKIYINGNIHRTQEKHQRRDGVEYLWLGPGEHRIVVREWEVFKTDRLESNTLWFTATEDAAVEFEVGLIEGQLKLKQI